MTTQQIKTLWTIAQLDKYATGFTAVRTAYVNDDNELIEYCYLVHDITKGNIVIDKKEFAKIKRMKIMRTFDNYAEKKKQFKKQK